MKKEGTLADFKDYYLGLEGCCLGDDVRNLVNRSVRLVGFFMSEPDGPGGGAITKLDNGDYAVFGEWQDYTGHG